MKYEKPTKHFIMVPREVAKRIRKGAERFKKCEERIKERIRWED